MSLTDIDDLTSRLSGGSSGAPETMWWFKHDYIAGTQAVAFLANQMHSLWRFSGQPGAGVAPTTVAAPTNATAGSLQQTDAAGGLSKYLIGGGVAGTNDMSFILYDRLLHIGGLDATLTTAQTVGGSLTRNTGGVGNMIFAEIYTQIGATGTTITCSYTDDAGNTGQTTGAMTFGGTGFREANLMIPFQLATGDKGVRAVATTTVLASTLTAGNFGITIARPLLMFGVRSSALASGALFDCIQRGVAPLIDAGACLAMMGGGAGTAAGRSKGHFNFVSA